MIFQIFSERINIFFYKIVTYFQVNKFSPYPLYVTILMSREEHQLLCKILKDKKSYLEFGTGGSTIDVLKRTKVVVHSVDSDIQWVEKVREFYSVKKALKQGRLFLYHADIGPVKSYGYPLDADISDSFERYYQGVFDCFGLSDVDVVLVDGRFRIACTLSCIKNLSRNITILIHDFWHRDHYHAVLKYVDVIDRVDSMAVLKIKDVIDQNELLQDIQKYSRDTF